jgi:NAD(P)-dependent dehydrogenase (short-subunit alcohol dehydrogenase family)
LHDKVAILTGAASGIGEAVAERYLSEGARCVLVDVKFPDAICPDLAKRHPEHVHLVRADVTQREDIARIVAQAVERFGGIDILFNNAAIFDMRPLLDESWETFDQLFAVNVKGMFFLMQAVAQRMVDQGRGGKIINMSSQAGGGHAIPPECSQLNQPSHMIDAGRGRPGIAFGCATYSNLAEMLARPADLVAPVPYAGADAALGASAVRAYEEGRTQPLNPTSTTTSVTH